MKKALSTVFVFLLLLNVVGYYGVFVGLRYKTAQDLVARLDLENYKDYEQVVFKIPVRIPYVLDAQEYQRVDGEFEYKGEVYRLVKQKLLRDTLHLVCIKDHHSNRIEQALSDYVRTFTDDPSGKDTGGSKPGHNLIKDFLPGEIPVSHCTAGWRILLSFAPVRELYVYDPHTLITHPPEA